MLNHHKAYRFRIYPDQDQMVLIHKTLGSTRFVFNFFLAEQRKKDAYWHIVNEMVQHGQLPKNNWKSAYFHKYTSIKDLKELKQHHPFLKEVDSIALQKSIENLHDSYTRYYKKQNRQPHFKSKKNPVQSYTTKCINGNIAIEGDQLKLPKLGWIRFAKSREVEGRILNATIRRNPSGKYFVSIVAEVNIQPLPKTLREAGVKIGIEDIEICSNETVYKDFHFLRNMEKRLIKEQRTLSRRIIGSSNWVKQKTRVARIYESITEAKKDYLHKISTALVKNHDLITVEDLQVSHMLNNHRLYKSIIDVSRAEFLTMLQYKAKWLGKHVVAVSP